MKDIPEKEEKRQRQGLVKKKSQQFQGMGSTIQQREGFLERNNIRGEASRAAANNLSTFEN